MENSKSSAPASVVLQTVQNVHISLSVLQESRFTILYVQRHDSATAAPMPSHGGAMALHY